MGDGIDVAPRPIRVLSLFSGAGGLDLGVSRAVRRLGGSSRVVCYVEREAPAAGILAARMGDGLLDRAPVWSDVTTFDARCWRGCVDLVVGGFPCTDVSNAGKRAGLGGSASGLWREYRRIVRDVGPRLVFVENVAALRSRGLAEVLGDLAALGFDAEWECLRASDVGAPHRRDRIFILAHAECEFIRDESGRRGREDGADSPGAGAARAPMAHAARVGWSEWWPERTRAEGRSVAADGGLAVADAHEPGLARRQIIGGDASAKRAAVERGGGSLVHTNERGCASLGRGGLLDGERAAQRDDVDGSRGPSDLGEYPPGPDDLDAWNKIIAVRPDLAPATAQPGLRRVAHGLADRVDRLRALGNGVVPEQAARAFVDLWCRIGGTLEG